MRVLQLLVPVVEIAWRACKYWTSAALVIPHPPGKGFSMQPSRCDNATLGLFSASRIMCA